ncbi:hypothetical protein ACWGF2_12425 [Streptomyces sp. NPDC054919]
MDGAEYDPPVVVLGDLGATPVARSAYFRDHCHADPDLDLDPEPGTPAGTLLVAGFLVGNDRGRLGVP